ncbi:MAG: protein of unknown function DUF6 transmembrane [Parcubacteria group bacterium Gr01-1014_19]|nr:MAG: protein of unknown function DUF6 transmembrane [Parcubacteria group bacterium Gr01-1014_19]
MFSWLFYSLGSAVTTSLTQVFSKEAILDRRYSNVAIKFVSALVASVLLFVVAYLYGFPNLDPRFWPAVIITGAINNVSALMYLRAYQVGEFSSVYSMSLMTPIFLLLTSFVLLGEKPTLLGAVGVFLTIIGLWVAFRKNTAQKNVQDFTKGNLLGLSVALLSSLSVNFDKAAALYSNRIFAPAATLAFMAISYGLYLLVRRQRFFVAESLPTGRQGLQDELARKAPWWFAGMPLLLLMGVLSAGGTVLYNSALLGGFASYTIAVKRVGVLLGVIWGWLFFKEKDLGKKLLGAAIAIAGVVAILWS